MIWVILFFIIILISSVLAYRSMRDYEEFPDNLSLNALFYIGNPQNLTVEVLKKIHDFFLNEKKLFSIEKLIKGKERARVMFGPRELSDNFPELNLVEIEDYLADESSFSPSTFDKKVNVNESISWLIDPKNNPKKVLHIDEELRNLVVDETQRVFIQAVLMPIEKAEESTFQSTIRVMVADQDPVKRVELAKKIDQLFTETTGLHKHQDSFPESKKYESFRQRSLVPKEVFEFPFRGEEILALIA